MSRPENVLYQIRLMQVYYRLKAYPQSIQAGLAYYKRQDSWDQAFQATFVVLLHPLLQRAVGKTVALAKVFDGDPLVTPVAADQELFFKRVQVFCHKSFSFRVEVD